MKTHVLALAAALTLAANTTHAADPAAGKAKAQGQCAVCHGIDGIAKNPEAPHLAGEQANYIVKQLKAFKTGARKHDQMSIIAEGLSDEDAADIAAWYAKVKVTATMPE
jgi:cytochrome c553